MAELATVILFSIIIWIVLKTAQFVARALCDIRDTIKS